MRKLYNKALLFQCYYNGKIGILGGGLLFSFFMFTFLQDSIDIVSFRISQFEGDNIIIQTSVVLFCLFILLWGVYVLIKGFNKRNTQNFLISGPFTKEDILKNELISIFSALIFFIILFIYISIVLYIRNEELLKLVPNYWSEIGYIILNIFLLGTAFILYLTLMDLFFTNTIVTIISMVFVPILSLAFISGIINIFVNFSTGERKFLSIIYNNLRRVWDFTFGYYYAGYTYEVDEKAIRTIVGISFWIISIIILSILIIKINNIITINSFNKLFACNLVERFVLWLICTVIIIYSVLFLTTSICSEVIYNYYNSVKPQLAGIIAIGFGAICSFIGLIVSTIIKRKIDKII